MSLDCTILHVEPPEDCILIHVLSLDSAATSSSCCAPTKKGLRNDLDRASIIASNEHGLDTSLVKQGARLGVICGCQLASQLFNQMLALGLRCRLVSQKTLDNLIAGFEIDCDIGKFRPLTKPDYLAVIDRKDLFDTLLLPREPLTSIEMLK
ncbi:MAG: hypothetical protein M1820_001108 [Bogoriella megaspora]|nr:MAG: hypothetical protein M1820_001108 [Bogoriella megaspora]